MNRQDITERSPKDHHTVRHSITIRFATKTLALSIGLLSLARIIGLQSLARKNDACASRSFFSFHSNRA